MARALRIQYEGAIYHVTCRGNERREIFKDDHDREKFLRILKDSLDTYQVKLHAYVLMENHFHLLLETPLANLSEFMRSFNITYTSYYNHKYDRVGHLYQGRFKSLLVEKESYLAVLSRYIHLNPIKTDAISKLPMKEREKMLLQYRWSSLPGYLKEKNKEDFVSYELVFDAYSGDNDGGRKNYWMTLRRDMANGLEIKDKIVAQSLLGGEGFIKRMKKFLAGRVDREVPSSRTIQHYQEKDRIIQAVCEKTGLEFEELRRSRDVLRWVMMDLLYRLGGMKGEEIGDLLGVTYSTVSQGRRRLREKMKEDLELSLLVKRIEDKLSRMKI
ncbi:MAG: transposase [bacterium]